jgi:hypothetical protein
MTTIVGIFDSTRDMDQAVERLAEAGFEDTVYDDAIVALEAVNVGPIVAPAPVTPVAPSIAKSDSPPEPDFDAIVRAFKTRLADYHLPNEVINAYATTLYHCGKFILVRTEFRARRTMPVVVFNKCIDWPSTISPRSLRFN